MALRDRLIDGVLTAVPDCTLTGHRTERLANHASFIMRGIEAEGMLIGLDMAGICASSGSACTSGAQEPSHVLTAMGIPRQEAAGHLRLSLGHSNGEQMSSDCWTSCRPWSRACESCRRLRFVGLVRFSCHTLSPVLNYHGGTGRRSQRRPAHFLLVLFIPDLWRLFHVERQVS